MHEYQRSNTGTYSCENKRRYSKTFWWPLCTNPKYDRIEVRSCRRLERLPHVQRDHMSHSEVRNRRMWLVRGVRARSVRVLILSLECYERHCITHSHHCTRMSRYTKLARFAFEHRMIGLGDYSGICHPFFFNKMKPLEGLPHSSDLLWGHSSFPFYCLDTEPGFFCFAVTDAMAHLKNCGKDNEKWKPWDFKNSTYVFCLFFSLT